MDEASNDGRGGVATRDREYSVVEQQLEAIERTAVPRPPGWAWLLVGLGALLVIGLSVHAGFAFSTITRLDQAARIDSHDPLSTFQNLATNGAQVPSAIDSSNRNTYTRALDQYAFDGTGICLGVALIAAGLFIRLNR